jgi:hypothetical protein
MAQLVQLSMRCERADLLATSRIRSCSTGLFRVLGITLADPDRAALAAATGSVESDFPTLQRFSIGINHSRDMGIHTTNNHPYH